MYTMTDAVTGATLQLEVNEHLTVGETFRLIGRTTPFKAGLTYKSKVCGPMVNEVSLCGKYRTAARVIDTAKVADGSPPHV